jgi:hypothetical protein
VRRLLVVDVEMATTSECGACAYAKPPGRPEFCELFVKQSVFTPAGMLRVNDCFTAERRYLDPAWRHAELASYDHPLLKPGGEKEGANG